MQSNILYDKFNSIVNKKFVIFVMGPTASGKSALAMHLRKYLPVELISVDSALIYKHMDIGTAKPSSIELSKHPHRLINVVDPGEWYSVSNFRRDVLQSIQEIFYMNKIPLLVGGTMLYYHILLNGISALPKADLKLRRKFLYCKVLGDKNFLHKYLSIIDSDAAKIIHPNDIHRIIRALEVYFITGQKMSILKKKTSNVFPYDVIQFAVIPDKLCLYNKIKYRFYNMLHQGLEFEVRKLFYRGDLNIESPAIRCIGYRHMWLYLLHEISYNQMIHDAIIATRKFAKKQMTWLKRWPNVHILCDKKLNLLTEKILYLVYRRYLYTLV
ncbi:tRNA (adenosine(37)-N6)-dimethylallyltransferase MiaA [Buchnera aphidicola]|uniref:tRNA dimethylallyltransferase n=1 Tax=Buchnera aphidicola (Sarucallis kahawaluokalani) TaxID=1241878 RepID=A0A4D6Y8B2_9GAMM|nr:tRNA (adenosine(37)-N6)-dimethylallyltransferase MiaA [Buchnera aphidicola]QCI26166.1 tRNA (adenosine(37)-N6)-dimethylallyltransferase MiaA [Buchnera aphidicola (Sarucallis kahawaluokalani)]